MIGQLLDGRYRIASKLGEGGFGHTYLAHDTRIPNEPLCVVKHLKPANSDREYLKVANRLFTSEAQTLAQLGNHDRIPRLLAYFEQASEFYLVEEFIEGRSLDLELVHGYRLSETQVIQILDELLSILEYTHSQGVIHRDIKPDNIIRRNSDSKLVLIDFGAIKQVQTLINQEGQTIATVAIGTLGYMPSEQAQGKPRQNSDVYAVGMIGIQALTGLKPRELQEDYQTGELIWQHLVPNKSELIAVLAKMTRYHYKDRYETAAEIRKLLEALGSNYLPTQQIRNSPNGLQSTIINTNSGNSQGTTPAPTQAYVPVIAQPPHPLVQALPTTNSLPPTTPINRKPAAYNPYEQSSPPTVQAYAPNKSNNDGDNRNNNSGAKGIWIAAWGGTLTAAIAIGAFMATRNNPVSPPIDASNSSNKPTNIPSVEPKVISSSPNVSIEATSTPSPSAAASPKVSAQPTPPATTSKPPTKSTITPLSESEALAIVNSLVASKNQIFAPPFDRQLLAELTTGEAYEKRKGSIDWLQNNNAFYRYGESKVDRAGSFGTQDNQANVTVEISESPTLYVNGKIDRSQSQQSKDRYICNLRFEDGKWKIASLTKVN